MNGLTKQIIATFLISVPSYFIAVGNTWPSYALQLLESEESPLGYKITRNDGILIGSLVMLGSLTSLLVAGYVMDKIGRKKTEILCGLFFTLAWSIIATAKSVTHILIGRFITGLGSGLHFGTGIVYISEITHPSLKGPLLCVCALVYNIGALLSYAEGWFCSYYVISYINLTVLVGFLLLILCIKESPIYLLRIGKEKEAINSLMFYRGASEETPDILNEFIYLRSQLKNDNLISESDNTDLKTSQIFYEMEKLKKEKEIEINITHLNIRESKGLKSISKASQRALVLMVINMALVTSMGMIAVQVYAGQFFTKAVPSLSPHLCSVLLAVVMTLGSGMSVFLTDLINRRVLMISTCITCAVCMGLMASMFRWSWAPDWGTPLAMVFYCIAYQLGVINLPFVQLTEYLPPQMNSLGSSAIVSSMFLTNFIVLYTFKPAVDYFGLDIVFLIFGVFSLINAAISFLFMRETRNVPFETTINSFEQGYLYRRENLKE